MNGVRWRLPGLRRDERLLLALPGLVLMLRTRALRPEALLALGAGLAMLSFNACYGDSRCTGAAAPP